MREDVDKRFHHSLDWWVRETHMAWLSWIKLTCDVEINVHRKASQFILTLTIHYTSNAIIIWLQLQGNNNCDAIPLKTLCWSKRLTSFAAAGVEVEISGTLQLRLIRGQFCSEIMTNTYSIRSAVSICISRNRLVNVDFRNYPAIFIKICQNCFVRYAETDVIAKIRYIYGHNIAIVN